MSEAIEIGKLHGLDTATKLSKASNGAVGYSTATRWFSQFGDAAWAKEFDLSAKSSVFIADLEFDLMTKNMESLREMDGGMQHQILMEWLPHNLPTAATPPSVILANLISERLLQRVDIDNHIVSL